MLQHTITRFTPSLSLLALPVLTASGAPYSLSSFLTIPINYEANGTSPFLLFVDSRGSPSLVWNYVSDDVGMITAIQIACVNASEADPAASEAYLRSGAARMGDSCLNVIGPSAYPQGSAVQFLGRWEETHGRMQLYVQGLEEAPGGILGGSTWSVTSAVELTRESVRLPQGCHCCFYRKVPILDHLSRGTV